MSTAPAPAPTLQTAAGPPARRTLRFEASAPWAGLAIASMWIAVLAVGLWGGDIYSSSTGGSVSKVPAVIVVVICALIGTSAVAKRAFRAAGDEDLDALRAALDDERRAREALERDVAELRVSGAR
ncbi:MAG TPA: hypothetical protein VFT50_10570 [Baekduia sp.]|nr:hypothetical protein [Baekduia sp.]